CSGLPPVRQCSCRAYTKKGVLCEHTLSITLILKPITLFQLLEYVLHLLTQADSVAL
ncbi:SWIM zinc finger family protein, partial [Prevotella sp.]